MTISHLDVKVYNTIAIHNNKCNISTCLNCLPFKSQQFRARQMKPRFFAHQLAQGPSETVDHLPSDPKHSEFFLLDTASPARCPVQMQGKASFSCRVVHANWLFLNPYLKCAQVCPIFSTWRIWAAFQSYSQSTAVMWKESGCEVCASSELSATVLSRPRHF